MAGLETKLTAAPSPEEQQKQTPSTDTRTENMSGPSVEATFDFSKQSAQAEVSRAEKPEAATEQAAEQAADSPDKLGQQTQQYQNEVALMDRRATESGKALSNSEFVGRADLLNRVASLRMLGLQKNFELMRSNASLSPEAKIQGTKQFAETRRALISELMTQGDQNMTETFTRYTDLIAGENNADLLLVSRATLEKAALNQLLARADLEGAQLFDYDGNNEVVQELVKSILDKRAAGETGKKTESGSLGQGIIKFVADLESGKMFDLASKEVSAEKKKEKADSAVASLALDTMMARLAASAATPEQRAAAAMLAKNVEAILKGAATGAEAVAKEEFTATLTSMVSTEQPVATQADVTGRALDKFVADMKAAQEGKASAGFMKALSALGKISTYRKLGSGMLDFASHSVSMTGRALELSGKATAAAGEGLAAMGRGVQKMPELLGKGWNAIKSRVEGFIKDKFGRSPDLAEAPVAGAPATAEQAAGIPTAPVAEKAPTTAVESEEVRKAREAQEIADLNKPIENNNAQVFTAAQSAEFARIVQEARAQEQASAPVANVPEQAAAPATKTEGPTAPSSTTTAV
jgi:hypothetical protein